MVAPTVKLNNGREVNRGKTTTGCLDRVRADQSISIDADSRFWSVEGSLLVLKSSGEEIALAAHSSDGVTCQTSDLTRSLLV